MFSRLRLVSIRVVLVGLGMVLIWMLLMFSILVVLVWNLFLMVRLVMLFSMLVSGVLV